MKQPHVQDSGASPQAKEGLRAQEIAMIWQLPRGTVYWLASKHRWRKYTLTGRAYYHPDDVLDTMN